MPHFTIYTVNMTRAHVPANVSITTLCDIADVRCAACNGKYIASARSLSMVRQTAGPDKPLRILCQGCLAKQLEDKPQAVVGVVMLPPCPEDEAKANRN